MDRNMCRRQRWKEADHTDMYGEREGKEMCWLFSEDAKGTNVPQLPA